MATMATVRAPRASAGVRNQKVARAQSARLRVAIPLLASSRRGVGNGESGKAKAIREDMSSASAPTKGVPVPSVQPVYPFVGNLPALGFDVMHMPERYARTVFPPPPLIRLSGFTDTPAHTARAPNRKGA